MWRNTASATTITANASDDMHAYTARLERAGSAGASSTAVALGVGVGS
jgi:hypothetical protein